MTAPTRFVTANGIRYACRRFGAETGTPLVFLQHFRGGMDHWDPAVMDGLAANRPVMLFDNTGVASSSGQTRTPWKRRPMTRRRSLPVHGLGKALFCHATPRDDEEVVLVDSRLDRWREVLSGLDTDIRTVVCGHTHMPFVRLAHGRLVINPGSIGMPYGRAGAHWALLDPGVELRSTAFDIEAAITQVTQDSAEIVRPAAA
ncbi:metallophosphoesterase family protein [Streptomyces mirabilis]|uniref:Calcineurin-like phosphoesterase superfamily domain-containing protein n=1 Tax=Streptomyces mirabilis TaxID=68239 RepID=A0A1I2S2W1_9ACTN|nr:metallophosphoesterase family protein [Streptomyces mirabilis]SFG45157.1 Calcineurin-like phosphoesterase superfamily domain-containing protein [Streptomyces mirabilis]